MTNLVFKPLKSNNIKDFARCLYLRGIVFGAGQNIAVNDDIDDLEASCRHILGLDDGQPCATARWRVYKQGVAKIERVAVHPNWRRKIWPIEGPRAYASEAKSLPEANGAASERPYNNRPIEGPRAYASEAKSLPEANGAASERPYNNRPIEGPRAYASEATREFDEQNKQPSLPEANGAASERPYKPHGIGTRLMHAVMDDIRATAPDCKTFRLGAQDYAIPFYERLGFAVDGDGFMDAGTPHHWMQKAA